MFTNLHGNPGSDPGGLQFQHDMDSAEIDRVLQALPFSQDSEPFSKPRPQRPVFWFHTRRYGKK